MARGTISLDNVERDRTAKGRATVPLAAAIKARPPVHQGTEMMWVIILFNIATGQQMEIAAFLNEAQCRAQLPYYRSTYDDGPRLFWCKERPKGE
jgi:hypothetical protein